MPKLNFNNKFLSVVLVVVIAFVVGAAFTFAAWDTPDLPPPQANVSAPLNIGGDLQYKTGGLGIGGIFEVDSDVEILGKIELGTSLTIGAGAGDRRPILVRDPNDGGLIIKSSVSSTGGDLIYLGANDFELLRVDSISGAIKFAGDAGSRQPILYRDSTDGGLVVDSSSAVGGAFIYKGDNNEEKFKITKTGEVCIGGVCKSSWDSIGGLWNGTVPGDIYYDQGNVGIGTDSPSGTLDVGGDICFSGDCRSGWSASSLWTEDGADIYRSTGKVSIGGSTPDPNHTLTVSNGSLRSQGAYFEGNVDVTGIVSSDGFTSSGTITGTSFRDSSDGNYFLDPANATKSIVVAGNVVIGTSDSYGRLTVDGGNIVLTRPLSANAPGHEIVLESWSGSMTTNHTEKDDLTFAEWNAGVDNCNVSDKLDKYACATPDASGYTCTDYYVEGGAPFLSYWKGTATCTIKSSKYSVRTNAGTMEFLDNLGTVRVTIGQDGYVGAEAFTYISDRRKKTNIQNLSDSLDKILQLDGVSYNWKESGNADVGLIAQDVEKVFPELVSENSSTGMKSLDYGKLVAPLIEAVKEQQAQINALKAEVEELKTDKN